MRDTGPYHGDIDYRLDRPHAIIELEEVTGKVTWKVEGRKLPDHAAYNYAGVHFHAWQQMLIALPYEPPTKELSLKITATDDVETVLHIMRVIPA